MFRAIRHSHGKPRARWLSALVAFAFLINAVFCPHIAYAQSILNLPQPGSMVPLSPVYQPALIKGLKIFPDNPLQFDFIIDPGDSQLKDEALKSESSKLIKYFLAALTIPEENLWVNLSPYEKNRIIPNDFAQTEMGRDLLAQDYLLKQITASLIYPEDELGKKFWDRVYKRAHHLYGTTEIPVNTFNKVWIVPQKATVYEEGDMVFVVDSYLKVMLEEDYLAMRETGDVPARGGSAFGGKRETNKKSDDSRDTYHVSQIIKEIIIPELEKEVNTGENFANLRQIYHAVILATWFKKNLSESYLGQVYVDQQKTDGVHVTDKEIHQKIYNQYLEAFKRGVYDYIKEDYDPTADEMIPRKYFSGGAVLAPGEAFGKRENFNVDLSAETVAAGVNLVAQLPEQSDSDLAAETETSYAYLSEAGVSVAAAWQLADQMEEVLKEEQPDRNWSKVRWTQGELLANVRNVLGELQEKERWNEHLQSFGDEQVAATARYVQSAYALNLVEQIEFSNAAQTFEDYAEVERFEGRENSRNGINELLKSRRLKFLRTRPILVLGDELMNNAISYSAVHPGIRKAESFLYEKEDEKNEKTSYAVRFRIIQHGVRQEGLWTSLKETAEAFQRQGYQYLLDREERVRLIQAGGGVGLKNVAEFMAETDVSLTYERLDNDNIVTDIWINIDPFLEETDLSNEKIDPSSEVVDRIEFSRSKRSFDGYVELGRFVKRIKGVIETDAEHSVVKGEGVLGPFKQEIESLVRGSFKIGDETVRGAQGWRGLNLLSFELSQNAGRTNKYRSALTDDVIVYESSAGTDGKKSYAMRFRMVQEGLRDEEHWRTLRRNKIRFAEDDYGYLLRTHERVPDGNARRNGGNGLLRVGWMMSETDVFLTYEKLANGSVVTDVWINIDPFLEESEADLSTETRRLNTQFVSEMPWVEMVRDPLKHPTPMSKVQRNYQNNEREWLNEFLSNLDEITGLNPDEAYEVLRFEEIVNEWYKIHMKGLSGKSYYYTPTLGIFGGAHLVNNIPDDVKRSIDQLVETGTKFSSAMESLDRLGVLLEKLQGILKMRSEEPSEAEANAIVHEVANFYLLSYTPVSPYNNSILVGKGHNSFFMNLSNALLRLHGLRGISHDRLDENYLNQKSEDEIAAKDALFREFTKRVKERNPEVFGEIDLSSDLSSERMLRTSPFKERALGTDQFGHRWASVEITLDDPTKAHLKLIMEDIGFQIPEGVSFDDFLEMYPPSIVQIFNSPESYGAFAIVFGRQYIFPFEDPYPLKQLVFVLAMDQTYEGERITDDPNLRQTLDIEGQETFIDFNYAIEIHLDQHVFPMSTKNLMIIPNREEESVYFKFDFISEGEDRSSESPADLSNEGEEKFLNRFLTTVSEDSLDDLLLQSDQLNLILGDQVSVRFTQQHTAEDVERVDDMVREYVTLNREQYKSKYIFDAIVKHVKKELQNLWRLEKVLREVMKNAFDYHNKPGAIQLDIKESAKHFIFEISDQGVGIDFEQSYQSESGLWMLTQNLRAKLRGNRFGGRRLGVAGSQMVLKMHGGTFEILPAKDEGFNTMVRIRIPKEKAQLSVKEGVVEVNEYAGDRKIKAAALLQKLDASEVEEAALSPAAREKIDWLRSYLATYSGEYHELSNFIKELVLKRGRDGDTLLFDLPIEEIAAVLNFLIKEGAKKFYFIEWNVVNPILFIAASFNDPETVYQRVEILNQLNNPFIAASIIDSMVLHMLANPSHDFEDFRGERVIIDLVVLAEQVSRVVKYFLHNLQDLPATEIDDELISERTFFLWTIAKALDPSVYGDYPVKRELLIELLMEQNDPEKLKRLFTEITSSRLHDKQNWEGGDRNFPLKGRLTIEGTTTANQGKSIEMYGFDPIAQDNKDKFYTTLAADVKELQSGDLSTETKDVIDLVPVAVLNVVEQIRESGAQTVILGGASALISYVALKAAWKEEYGPLNIYHIAPRDNRNINDAHGSLRATSLETKEQLLRKYVPVDDLKGKPVVYLEDFVYEGLKRANFGELLETHLGLNVTFAHIVAGREDYELDPERSQIDDRFEGDIVGVYSDDELLWMRSLAEKISNAVYADDTEFLEGLTLNNELSIEIIRKALPESVNEELDSLESNIRWEPNQPNILGLTPGQELRLNNEFRNTLVEHVTSVFYTSERWLVESIEFVFDPSEKRIMKVSKDTFAAYVTMKYEYYDGNDPGTIEDAGAVILFELSDGIFDVTGVYLETGFYRFASMDGVLAYGSEHEEVLLERAKDFIDQHIVDDDLRKTSTHLFVPSEINVDGWRLYAIIPKKDFKGDRALKDDAIFQKADADLSTESQVGGIDLNPADLELQRQGSGIKYNIPIPPLNTAPINGFTPVIIHITPISHYPLIIGEKRKKDASQLTLSSI